MFLSLRHYAKGRKLGEGSQVAGAVVGGAVEAPAAEGAHEKTNDDKVDNDGGGSGGGGGNHGEDMVDDDLDALAATLVDEGVPAPPWHHPNPAPPPENARVIEKLLVQAHVVMSKLTEVERDNDGTASKLRELRAATSTVALKRQRRAQLTWLAQNLERGLREHDASALAALTERQRALEDMRAADEVNIKPEVEPGAGRPRADDDDDGGPRPRVGRAFSASASAGAEDPSGCERHHDDLCALKAHLCELMQCTALVVGMCNRL